MKAIRITLATSATKAYTTFFSPMRFSPMRHATLPVIHTFRCVPCQLLALHVALLHPCFIAFSAFARFPSRFGGESMLQASSCFTRL